MFFADNHLHFFKPLTGKYREQILEIFSEAITRTPLAETAIAASASAPASATRAMRCGLSLNAARCTTC